MSHTKYIRIREILKNLSDIRISVKNLLEIAQEHQRNNIQSFYQPLDISTLIYY